MLRGYRTTNADPVASDPVASEPAVESRHAQPVRRPRRTGHKRANMPAKHLAPETKDPSPE